MPVDQASSRPAARPPEGAKLVRYHDYIDGKIESTRRMVKLVDLATAFVALAVAVLLFLLVVTVAEHWVVPGGLSIGARWVLFAALAAYVAYFAGRRLWPLCVRAINPVYAADTIEHGSPSLKNSLINLLMFRERRSDISDAVYRTLEEQAAHGLTRAPVDTAVDRSQLIRLGYVLIGVVAAAALYKVLSPKDPLVAAERVLMPWAEVVPASRVSITEIKPGVATISRGEFVDVSAEVRGLDDDDAVVLRYTTEDGQVVGRSIPMRASADGLRFACRLGDEAEGSESAGLTRGLVYWLEAGDARSLKYAITVVPAASILVERVDYDYPAYTGYVDRSVDRIGDLRAIEGTRVVVHARANGPIREANVDFDADGRRDLQMKAAGAKADATFELELREDRQTPRHASYVLRFTNDEGRTNHDPVKHAINVEPDIQPEAEIRLPREKSREVRVDENVAIEVVASDPDFALAAVRLRGKAAGRADINQPLLAGEQRGKFTGRYVLTPSAHGLKAGDELKYWIEADDNRTPKPNTTATEQRTLRIVSPNPAQQPPPDRIAKNERKQPQQGDQGNQQQQDGQPGGGQQGGGKQGQNAGDQKQDAPGGEGQQGENNPAQPSKSDVKEQEKSSQQGESGGQAQSGSGNEKNRPDQARKNTDGSEQGGVADQKNGQGQSGKQSKPGQTASDQQDQKKSQGEQTGAGAAGSESSKGGPQPAGTRPDSNKDGKSDAAKQQDGHQQNGRQQAKPDGEQAPVSSQGDNDAEAFDRIQKHMEKSGDLKRDTASDAKQRQGDKETRRPGESKDGESASADGKPGQEQKDAKQQPSGSSSNDRGEGTGAETRGDDLNQKQEPKSDQQQQEKSPGGEQTAPKGPAGAGHEEESQGAPNSKPGMRPKEKRQESPPNGEKSNQQEPPAGANSKRESDSQGGQGGDKAGGGEEGGGQKAPREGTGSAGQNQSADNGGGKSGEKGQGENSKEGGQDAKSDERTGSSDGKTQGKGSKQQDGTGDKPGGKPGDADKQQQPFSRDAQRSAEQQGKPGQGDKETGRQGDKEKDNQAAKQGDKDAGKQADRNQNAKDNKDAAENNHSGGASGGNGQPGGAMNPSPSITGEAPEGDAANLEYARKQTDLVVEKLADQLSRKRVDDKLLKELGWSEADLKKFVERWQQRKSAAERNDVAADAAKRELYDALRSLGLRRGDLQQSAVQKDALRDLREGYRGPVPAEYKERLRAYNQGVSRAHREGE